MIRSAVGVLLTLAVLFPQIIIRNRLDPDNLTPALTCTTTLSSPSAATVQTNVNSLAATANAVLCITGNATWSTDISLNNSVNGITLICQAQNCSIAGSGAVTMDGPASTITNTIRVSGFTFTASSGTAKIWLYGGTRDLQKLRVDHNTFTIGSTGDEVAVLLGELSATGKIYGVMDHNTCSGTNSFMCFKNISGGKTWTTGLQGSANSFFFEDNVCNFTTNVNSGSGCIDVWRANSTVARFNDLTNNRFVNHSYCHEGPINSEIYLNTITDPTLSGNAQYRNVHLQGSGEAMVWGNQVESNSGGDTMVVQNFRSNVGADGEGGCLTQCDGTVTGTGADSAHPNDGNRATQNGYPCWHQAGRDGSAVLKPIYSFLNRTAGGTRVDLVINNGSSGAGLIASHLQANRDFYNAVSASAQTSCPTGSTCTPFNGTTGVGYGTLALRPTTCTAEAAAADAGTGGVGYFATDQGSWNTSSSNSHGPQVSGQDGILYGCLTTNNWQPIYTPYTYPHPLIAASGG